MLHVSEDQQLGQIYREGDREAFEILGGNAEELRKEETFRAYKDMEEEKRIHEANARIERAFSDGLGEIACIMTLGTFNRMMLLFGTECWNDEGFIASYVKKNPGAKPRHRSRNTTLRVQGMRPATTTTGGILTP